MPAQCPVQEVEEEGQSVGLGDAEALAVQVVQAVQAGHAVCLEATPHVRSERV